MFPRIKSFVNQDGSTRKYLYIVENRKVKINLDNNSYIIRTELTGSAHFAFKAAKLKIPDRIIATSFKSSQKVMLRVCPLSAT